MERKGGALQCDILLQSREGNGGAELNTLQFSITTIRLREIVGGSTFTLSVEMCSTDSHKTPRRAVSQGERRNGYACSLSNKGTTETSSFFIQVMHTAAFLSIMAHF